MAKIMAVLLHKMGAIKPQKNGYKKSHNFLYQTTRYIKFPPSSKP